MYLVVYSLFVRYQDCLHSQRTVQAVAAHVAIQPGSTSLLAIQDFVSHLLKSANKSWHQGAQAQLQTLQNQSQTFYRLLMAHNWSSQGGCATYQTPSICSMQISLTFSSQGAQSLALARQPLSQQSTLLC